MDPVLRHLARQRMDRAWVLDREVAKIIDDLSSEASDRSLRASWSTQLPEAVERSSSA